MSGCVKFILEPTEIEVFFTAKDAKSAKIFNAVYEQS